jgi:hypothetical protein
MNLTDWSFRKIILRQSNVALAAWSVLALTALTLKIGWIDISTLETIPLCIFRFITDMKCPGCGMGHAVLAAFQGNFSESLSHHVLGIPILTVWTSWLVKERILAR